MVNHNGDPSQPNSGWIPPAEVTIDQLTSEETLSWSDEFERRLWQISRSPYKGPTEAEVDFIHSTVREGSRIAAHRLEWSGTIAPATDEYKDIAHSLLQARRVIYDVARQREVIPPPIRQTILDDPKAMKDVLHLTAAQIDRGNLSIRKKPALKPLMETYGIAAMKLIALLARWNDGLGEDDIVVANLQELTQRYKALTPRDLS